MSTQAPEFSKPLATAGASRATTVAVKPQLGRDGWVVALALIAIAVAYVSLVFLPGKRSIDELRNQIQLKRQYVAEGSGLVTMLRLQRNELERAQAYEAAWQKRTPPVEKRSSVEGKIYALAEAAGVTTTRFDPEPIVRYETISQIPLSIGCKGTFAQIGAFLHSLESLSILNWVTSVDLENLDATEAFVTCEVSMVVFADNSSISDYVKDSE
ncbi:MAG: type 4a pilus biogenesis protein PilO [Thermoguttaceae bacterium]